MLTPSGGLSRISGETGRPEKADRVWVVHIWLEGGFSAGKPRLLIEKRGFHLLDPIRGWDLWPDGRGFLMVKEEETKSRPVSEIILVQNRI